MSLTRRLGTSRMLVASVAALAASFAVVAPTAARTEADDPALQRRLDMIVPAGAIGVVAEVRTEHGVWRGSSGVAELGTSRKVSTHSRFRAGSVMKTFLATVVLQLVAEDRLRLEDSIEEWLPGVVPGGERISLRQLLAHTSGLFDVVRTFRLPPDPWFADNRWRTWTADELARRGLAERPTHAPGSAFAYSNTGYLLISQVIERVTGRSYAVEVKRRILEPLHLRHSELPGRSPWIGRPHMRGYIPVRRDGATRLIDFTVMNPSVFGPPGELISTTSDLNTFYAALLTGRLLPAHLLEEMKTPGIAEETYGLGLRWEAKTSCGVPVYGHDGDALAYQTWSFTTEDGHRQATVAVTPTSDGDVDDAVAEFIDQAVCD
ncbi:serine hydrolase domain-containing protein [Nocardioides sp. NPDC047086]|uniref:serine hydrolase domain-containing protein n=1 Tax=Nocardioides sp. NPDC047086 TaxID=3154810 RepID=UPI0033EB59F8